MKMFRLLLLTSLMPLLMATGVIHASENNSELAKSIDELKDKVIKLNRDLFILQEELLFPAETQVAVFLSVDSGAFFKLDSLELRLDDKPVTHFLYTLHQREALSRGGVQRLWTGNTKSGKHELVAFFKGIDKDGRPIERATATEFEKTDEAAMLEIKIIDSSDDMRPHFLIEQW